MFAGPDAITVFARRLTKLRAVATQPEDVQILVDAYGYIAAEVWN
jgi:hypothetical protein